MLERFSEQTNQQFLVNKEIMDQSVAESTKQFKTTTIMTVLVLVLTIINLISVLLAEKDSSSDEVITLLKSILKSIEGNLKAINE